MVDFKNSLQPEKVADKKRGDGYEGPKITKSKFKLGGLVIALVVIIVIVVGGGFFIYNQQTSTSLVNDIKETVEDIEEQIEDVIKPATVLAHNFASYEELAVNISPQVAVYSVDQDLANVTNQDRFSLSAKAKNLLVKNGFVIIPSYWQEFFSLYESNRGRQLPSFITTDSMLHNYHLAFDYLLRDLEKERLVPEVTTLTYEMRKAAEIQYQQLKGTDWENAAKRNVAFFTVANKLIYPEAEIPEDVKTEVEEELKLIEEHKGIDVSPVINLGIDREKDTWVMTPAGLLPVGPLLEDYSQYIPRGHYTKSDELKRYFKSMMYLGRMTFRLKSLEETKSAVLISLALKESEDRYNSWERVYEPTVFFVGKSDDINFYDYYDLLKSTYGTEEIDLTLLISNPEKFDSFLSAAKELSPPAINSIPIFEASFQPDREKEIKGFRFMGQRFTIDASIFQRLIYREVGDKTVACSDYDPQQTGCLNGARCLPKALDIPAALGSTAAKDILKSQGEMDYTCYSENLNKLREYISGLDLEVWTQNLYWGWLHSLRPLLETRGEGWPLFMQQTAWQHKDLNNFLGSWTELKHDTILYAKQAYAELGGGGDREEFDDRGYVEPNPYVYARLASLIKVTKEGLQIRGLLSDKNADFLDKMETLALRLKEISEKELNNVALADEDYNLIRAYGGSLEHLWEEAFKDRGITSRTQLSEEPAALVADVATDPNGYVLEEATGNIAEIYVVVPVEGKLRIAKGGVYTHYEFSWPLSDRLTDEKWREILKSDEVPALADWTQSFIVEK